MSQCVPQQITLMKKLDAIRNITAVNGVEYIVAMKQCAIATKVSDKRTGSKFYSDRKLYYNVKG